MLLMMFTSCFYVIDVIYNINIERLFLNFLYFLLRA